MCLIISASQLPIGVVQKVNTNDLNWGSLEGVSRATWPLGLGTLEARWELRGP